ncbi:MAG: aspartyl protease family protein [Phenylobacterium sp.]
MRCAALALLILAVLAPARPASAEPPARAIAFQFVLDRQIVFPITINGRPAEAWLDSGAGATVVDAAFAKTLGLALGAPIAAHGVAGKVADVRLAQADLKVGDLAMPGRRVAVMDLSAVARVTGRPVQVLLGRDVFDQAVVDLDFEGRRVELLPRSALVPPKEEPVPLLRSGDLRSIPIVVGGVATPAILDLGNAGGLLLDQGFVEANRLFAGRRLSTDLGVGADGAREHTIAALDKVSVAGVSFDGVTAVATPGLSSRAPANVGLQILSRFHLIIDFAGDRIWMTPYRDATARLFRKNRVGLMLVREPGGLLVDYVARGSPADRAGWKKGEVVTALDDAPIPADYAATEASLWVYGPPGRTVTLTTADGGKRKLTLADYY